MEKAGHWRHAPEGCIRTLVLFSVFLLPNCQEVSSFALLHASAMIFSVMKEQNDRVQNDC
jgi:hypothetical protein